VTGNRGESGALGAGKNLATGAKYRRTSDSQAGAERSGLAVSIAVAARRPEVITPAPLPPLDIETAAVRAQRRAERFPEPEVGNFEVFPAAKNQWGGPCAGGTFDLLRFVSV